MAAAAGLLGTSTQALTLARGTSSRPLLSVRARRELTRGSLGQRQLERAVTALRQCLGQLTTTQRRVLILRTGLGPRDALSRDRVARRLDLGLAQTRRIERRGLRRLSSLDAAGRCAGGGSGVALASSPFGTPPAAALVAASADGAVLGQQRGGVMGVSGSGGDDDGPSLADALPPPLGQGSDWTLLILLMAAAMVALLVRRELRRQRGH